MGAKLIPKGKFGRPNFPAGQVQTYVLWAADQLWTKSSSACTFFVALLRSPGLRWFFQLSFIGFKCFLSKKYATWLKSCILISIPSRFRVKPLPLGRLCTCPAHQKKLFRLQCGLRLWYIFAITAVAVFLSVRSCKTVVFESCRRARSENPLKSRTAVQWMPAKLIQKDMIWRRL